MQRPLKSDPPSLELDIGYSIPEQKPSIKLRIPQGYFSGGRNSFGFPLRVWRVRLRARCDAKRGIHAHSDPPPAIVEEIKHRGQVMFNELSSEFCVKIASELPKKIQELTPAPFALEESKRALGSSLQGWLRGYEEVLKRARCDLDKAQEECAKADDALQKFANDEKVPRRPRTRRPWIRRASTLLIFVAAEAMLGSFLFLPSMQGPRGTQSVAASPIGGAMVALLISVSNAFLGWLMGSFAAHQLLDGTRRWYRVAGGIFCLVNAAAAIGTNLLVARQREEGLPSPPQVLPSTAFGWVLFVAGLCVWSFAAIKGYREFSPGKLGHRELWDDWREKKFVVDVMRARYRSLLVGLQKSAEAIAHQLRTKLEQLVVVHEIRRDQIKGLLCDNQCLKAQIDLCKQGIEGAVRVLLGHYWEINAIRTNATPQLGTGSPQSTALTKPQEWEPKEAYDLTTPDTTANTSLELITRNIEEIRQLQVGFEEEFTQILNKSIPDILAKFPAEEEAASGAHTSSQQVVTPMGRLEAAVPGPIPVRAS
jgi:hypothetical protein